MICVPALVCVPRNTREGWGGNERYSSCHCFVTMVTVTGWYTLTPCLICSCCVVNCKGKTVRTCFYNVQGTGFFNALS